MHVVVQGRVGILLVHSRNKKVEEGLDYHKVARATAGFTGAELMNLMNTAAVVAVRRGAKIVTEEDVFQVDANAIWNELLLMCRVRYKPQFAGFTANHWDLEPYTVMEHLEAFVPRHGSSSAEPLSASGKP